MGAGDGSEPSSIGMPYGAGCEPGLQPHQPGSAQQSSGLRTALPGRLRQMLRDLYRRPSQPKVQPPAADSSGPAQPVPSGGPYTAAAQPDGSSPHEWQAPAGAGVAASVTLAAINGTATSAAVGDAGLSPGLRPVPAGAPSYPLPHDKAPHGVSHGAADGQPAAAAPPPSDPAPPASAGPTERDTGGGGGGERQPPAASPPGSAAPPDAVHGVAGGVAAPAPLRASGPAAVQAPIPAGSGGVDGKKNTATPQPAVFAAADGSVSQTSPEQKQLRTTAPDASQRADAPERTAAPAAQGAGWVRLWETAGECADAAADGAAAAAAPFGSNAVAAADLPLALSGATPAQASGPQAKRQQGRQQGALGASDDGADGAGAAGTAAAAVAAASDDGVVVRMDKNFAGRMFRDAGVAEDDTLQFERRADGTYHVTVRDPSGQVRQPPPPAAPAAAPNSRLAGVGAGSSTGAVSAGRGGGGGGAAAVATAGQHGGSRAPSDAVTAAGDRAAPAEGADAAVDGNASAALTVVVGSSIGATGAQEASCGPGGALPSERESGETTAGNASATNSKQLEQQQEQQQQQQQQAGASTTPSERGEAGCRAAVGGRTSPCRGGAAGGAQTGDPPGPVAEAEVASEVRAGTGGGKKGTGADSGGGLEARRSVPQERAAPAAQRPLAVHVSVAESIKLGRAARTSGGGRGPAAAAAEAAAAAAAAGSTAADGKAPPPDKKPGKKPKPPAKGGAGGSAVAATAAAAEPLPQLPASALRPPKQGKAAAAGSGDQPEAQSARSKNRIAKPSDERCCKVLPLTAWVTGKLVLNKSLTQPGGVFHGLPQGMVVLQQKDGPGRWQVCKSAIYFVGIRKVLKGLGLTMADCEAGCAELAFEPREGAPAGASGLEAAAADGPSAPGGVKQTVGVFVVTYRRLAAPAAADDDNDPGMAGPSAAGAAVAKRKPQSQLQRKKRAKKEATPSLAQAAAGVGMCAAVGCAAEQAGGQGAPGGEPKAPEEQVLPAPAAGPALSAPADAFRAAAADLTLQDLFRNRRPPPSVLHLGHPWLPAEELGLPAAAGGGGDGAAAAVAAERLALCGVVFPAGPVAAKARAAAVAAAGNGGNPAADWEVPGLDKSGRTLPGWPRRSWHALFGPEAPMDAGVGSAVSDSGSAAAAPSPPPPLSVPVLLDSLRQLVEQLRRGCSGGDCSGGGGCDGSGRKGREQSGGAAGRGGGAAAGPVLLPTGPLHLPCLRPCRDEARGGLGVCTEADVAAGAPLGVLAGRVLCGRRAGPWDEEGDGGGASDAGSDAALYAREGYQWIRDEELLRELRRRGGGEPGDAWLFLAQSYQLPYPEELGQAAQRPSRASRNEGGAGGAAQAGRHADRSLQAEPHVLCMLGHGSVLSLLNDGRRMMTPAGLQEAFRETTAAANCAIIPVAFHGVVLPAVVALRRIAPGEQLLLDYGLGWWRELAAAWELAASCDLSPPRLLHGDQPLEEVPPPGAVPVATTAGASDAATQDAQQQDAPLAASAAGDEGKGLQGPRARGSEPQSAPPPEGSNRKRRRSPPAAGWPRPGDQEPQSVRGVAERDRKRGRENDGRRDRSPGPYPRDHGPDPRDRENSRNHERDRDRARDRDRDRGRGGGRVWDWPSRSNSRDRGRERGRGRERSHPDHRDDNQHHHQERNRPPAAEKDCDSTRSREHKDGERERGRDGRERDQERRTAAAEQATGGLPPVPSPKRRRGQQETDRAGANPAPSSPSGATAPSGAASSGFAERIAAAAADSTQAKPKGQQTAPGRAQQQQQPNRAHLPPPSPAPFPSPLSQAEPERGTSGPQSGPDAGGRDPRVSLTSTPKSGPAGRTVRSPVLAAHVANPARGMADHSPAGGAEPPLTSLGPGPLPTPSPPLPAAVQGGCPIAVQPPESASKTLDAAAPRSPVLQRQPVGAGGVREVGQGQSPRRPGHGPRPRIRSPLGPSGRAGGASGASGVRGGGGGGADPQGATAEGARALPHVKRGAAAATAARGLGQAQLHSWAAGAGGSTGPGVPPPAAAADDGGGNGAGDGKIKKRPLGARLGATSSSMEGRADAGTSANGGREASARTSHGESRVAGAGGKRKPYNPLGDPYRQLKHEMDSPRSLPPIKSEVEFLRVIREVAQRKRSFAPLPLRSAAAAAPSAPAAAAGRPEAARGSSMAATAAAAAPSGQAEAEAVADGVASRFEAWRRVLRAQAMAAWRPHDPRVSSAPPQPQPAGFTGPQHF